MTVHPYFKTSTAILQVTGGYSSVLQFKNGTGKSQTNSNSISNRNDGPLTWENDHYLQDASYIRLKNITIDYTFPKHICKKLRLEGLKVYLSGENLFTHSPMFKHTDMFDPEVITSGDSDFAASTTSGLNGTGNGYSYPMLKTVTLGINVTF